MSADFKGKVLDAEPKSNYVIRTVVLVLLCLQNAGHALLARYSQGILKEEYSSSEVVLVGEFIKLAVSGYLAYVDRSETDAVGTGFSKLFWLVFNARKVIILVIIYSAANILSYYALARVDASVYSVTLQLKIFTTAAFAVLILGRNISSAKWRALFMLVLGCVLVASPTFNKCECSLEGEASSAKFSLAKGGGGNAAVEAIFGIGALLAMVIISGYSAVYFEGMLKKQGEKITIWERNFQLALYSIVLLVTIVLYEMQSNYDPDEPKVGPLFFKGWTFNAIALAILQSGGGLLVAATLKYADAILKTLATAGAIVLSTVMGWMLLGGQLDMFVGIGCMATILAIFNYILDTSV